MRTAILPVRRTLANVALRETATAAVPMRPTFGRARPRVTIFASPARLPSTAAQTARGGLPGGSTR